MRNVAEFQRKHEIYKQKLERSIAVLNDYIVAAQSTVVSEPSFGAKIELGVYDADKEQFELTVQDSASEKSPFLFKGKVGVPRDTAKAMNRAASGFMASLQFINFPFETEAGSVNLAMSKLLLLRNGSDLKVDGSFGEIERYKSLDGYDAWKRRADSLLSGSLKPQGLDYAYAVGKAAALGGVAVYKHLEAQKKVDKLNELNKNVPPRGDYERIEAWAIEHKRNEDAVRKNELHRSIYGGAAGVFAVGGIATFFF
jgi:hypothetical protein